MTYPSGLTVRRAYNAAGCLAGLVDAATNTALETSSAREAYGNVLSRAEIRHDVPQAAASRQLRHDSW